MGLQGTHVRRQVFLSLRPMSMVYYTAFLRQFAW